jgi:hypothetical protein
MSELEVQALRTNFENWRKERAPDAKPSEAFERYCAELVLKDYDLADEDITSGLSGDSDAGGVDAMYFFVNDQIILADTKMPQPVVNATLWIVQAKNEGGFGEVPVQKMEDFVSDLLDFGKPTSSINYYHQDIKDAIDAFRAQYTLIFSQPHEFRIVFVYLTRADQAPNPKVLQRRDNLFGRVKTFISSAKCDFQFWGAKELVEAFRTPLNDTLTLEIKESFMTADGSAVCLARLDKFASFLKDDKGHLRQYLFEPNVRDYNGKNNPVNEDIRKTLGAPTESKEFWWLNNGITILADSCSLLAGPSLQIVRPELVNGLQTSYEIFNFFKDHSGADPRMILVRVIRPPDDQSRRRIVKATNYQTAVSDLSLHATDDIHFDIEELLKLYGILYDRKKGENRRLRKPVSQIVSARSIAQAMIAIRLRRPNDARARPKSVYGSDAGYKSVFDETAAREVYLVCVLLDRQVETYLAGRTDISKDMRTDIRSYMDAWLASRLANKRIPTDADFVNLIGSQVKAKIPANIMDLACTDVSAVYIKAGGSDTAAKGTSMPKIMQTELDKIIP